MAIYLIRHPRPQVAADICYGSTDVPVDAITTARALAAMTPQLPRAARLFSSPLQRCLTLAESLAAHLECAVPMVDRRLRELDFGRWEMRCWNEIPHVEVNAWVADLAGYCPGGGESVRAMAERVTEFYGDQLTDSVTDTILVCHAGTMRLLLACHRGMTPVEMAISAAATPLQIGYGELIRLAP